MNFPNLSNTTTNLVTFTKNNGPLVAIAVAYIIAGVYACTVLVGAFTWPLASLSSAFVVVIMGVSAYSVLTGPDRV